MTDVQTIYIAGPMSGYKNFNYEAFNAAAAVLRQAGYTVLNPAEFDGGGQEDSWHNYMRKDLGIIIAEADALVCLQDWETSAGAKNEVTVARAIGIPVWDITEFAPALRNNERDEETWAKNHPEARTGEQQEPLPRPSWADDVQWFNPTSSVTGNGWGGTTATTYSVFIPEQRQASPVEAYTEGWGDGSPLPEEQECETDRDWSPTEEDLVDFGAALSEVLGFDDLDAPEPTTSILEEAEAAVNGPRQRDYDHPLDNFRRIAAMWSQVFECRNCHQPIHVTEEQHALAMVCVKIARLIHSPQHRDSQVDLAGYAATIEKLQRERRRRDKESLDQLLAQAADWERSLITEETDG